MKPFSVPVACRMLLLCICFSCSHFHHGNTSITTSEANDVFRMTANFDANKTKEIQEYIDECLDGHSNISFVNSRADASITMDDKTSFYIRSKPGDLEIKLNKKENSAASYYKIKKMCEGIKSIIEEK